MSKHSFLCVVAFLATAILDAAAEPPRSTIIGMADYVKMIPTLPHTVGLPDARTCQINKDCAFADAADAAEKGTATREHHYICWLWAWAVFMTDPNVEPSLRQRGQEWVEQYQGSDQKKWLFPTPFSLRK